MKPRIRKFVIGFALCVCLFAGFIALSEGGAFNTETWERQTPLVGAIAVNDVRGGVMTLSDGRKFRAAGVDRADGISEADFDKALQVVVAQGVTVSRDVGDGRAFLIAEPKFYNWCGTRGYGNNPWGHWAGAFLQCPVSELLIRSAYATANLEEPGLTAHECWRLEGTSKFERLDHRPRSLSSVSNAMEYNADFSYLSDLDRILEISWKAPPTR